MFTNITENDKKALTRQLGATVYNFAKGISFSSYIPLKGCVGVIDYGVVNVARIDEDGNQMVYEVLRENDIFSLELYPYTDMMELIAKEDIRVIIIETKRIQDLTLTTDYFHQFLKNYSRKLSQKIQYANEKITYMTCKTIRSKLLLYFKTQVAISHSKTFRLPFSYSLLADYLAIDRSAMNRELKNLKDEKVISSKGRAITLLIKDIYINY